MYTEWTEEQNIELKVNGVQMLHFTVPTQMQLDCHWTFGNKNPQSAVTDMLTSNITIQYIMMRGTRLVEALRYKSEGCGFDSPWYHWIFSFT